MGARPRGEDTRARPRGEDTRARPRGEDTRARPHRVAVPKTYLRLWVLPRPKMRFVR